MPLRKIALLAGAAGSVGLTLYAGRHNPSRLLMLLFAIWVVSPFAILFFTRRDSRRLDYLSVFLSLATIAIYGYIALGPPRPKTAFTFLVVPPASWVLIAVAAFLPHRR